MSDFLLWECAYAELVFTDRMWPDFTAADFAEALRYLRNHWQALNAYVSDGRVPIDNNAVERLMKQVAMGRKAWLFVASVAGGEQSAQLTTLVSSARRHDLHSWKRLAHGLDMGLRGVRK